MGDINCFLNQAWNELVKIHQNVNSGLVLFSTAPILLFASMLFAICLKPATIKAPSCAGYCPIALLMRFVYLSFPSALRPFRSFVYYSHIGQPGFSSDFYFPIREKLLRAYACHAGRCPRPAVCTHLNFLFRLLRPCVARGFPKYPRYRKEAF